MNLLRRSPRDILSLQDTQKELQLLQTLILSISQAGDLQTAISMTLASVCKTTGWTYGQAWMVRADGKALECSPAWFANAPGLEAFRKRAESVTVLPGHGLAGKAWAFKDPVWTADMQHEEDEPSGTHISEAGFRAGLGFPVMAGDEVVLILEFFLYEPRQEEKTQIQLINAIAAQLGWLIQKKMAEEALRESVERFELSARGSRDGLWDAKIAPEGEWLVADAPVYYSRRFKQLLGYTDSEMPNVLDSWRSLLHPQDKQRVSKALWDHLEKRYPYDVEYRLRVKSGEYRWFSTRGAAVWNAQGRPVRMSGSLRDITERKRMEQSMFQTEKISAVGQLAAGIAHELNNPLHAILGYAQGLLADADEAETSTRSLQFIEKEARRCQMLVQNLLTFARRHKRGISPEIPNEIVEEVLSLIEAQARVKNVALVREVAQDLPKIHVDRDQIQQMLLNLCANGLDAMAHGGTLTVRVGLGRNAQDTEKDILRIEVADTGEGISEELRHRIFEPFFTTKAVGKGTGLGLSLVYEIVKNHQGEISVSSETGKGSLFQAFLPLHANG